MQESLPCQPNTTRYWEDLKRNDVAPSSDTSSAACTAQRKARSVSGDSYKTTGTPHRADALMVTTGTVLKQTCVTLLVPRADTRTTSITTRNATQFSGELRMVTKKTSLLRCGRNMETRSQREFFLPTTPSSTPTHFDG